MDVNQGTVIKTMIEYDCLRLIHGHTHRPNIHNFEVNGKAAQRYVLAAWTKEQGEALVWNSNGDQIEVL
jgi:UDP-2,3-diacylglucosamine hydrolase